MHIFRFHDILSLCATRRDKETIVLVRDMNYTFLMAPCVALVVGMFGMCRGGNKVTRWLSGLTQRKRGYKKAEEDAEIDDQCCKVFITLWPMSPLFQKCKAFMSSCKCYSHELL